MPALKDQLGAAAAKALAGELSRARPEFPTARFTRGIAGALEPLELVARVDLLAERLVTSLPDDIGEAAEVLRRALGSPTFNGWMVWPCGMYVAKRGLNDPHAALPLLAELTPRWSSEFAVRPFIERHPEVAYDHFRRWCGDEDEHVRRLVSEGTRPRLPWAPLLRGLITDPSPNVPLLEALVDDPSAYVRRSVANHLNDISRDHPDLALDLAERWAALSAGGAWVAARGLRTLVKRGDARALAILGADAGIAVELLDLRVDRDSVRIGESVTFSFSLVLADGVPASDVVIDYRVHYAGARTTKAPKVFKLTRRRLEPGVPVTISRTHAFEHVSIRRIHPGAHRIDVQVNGVVLGDMEVQVRDQA